MFVRPSRYWIKRAVWAAAAFALCVGILTDAEPARADENYLSIPSTTNSTGIRPNPDCQGQRLFLAGRS